MSQYFPDPFERYILSNNLSNYETKTNLKGATGIDTSTLISTTDLVSLKTKVDSLDVGKLKTVPGDLSKLINVVESNFVKRVHVTNCYKCQCY